ncbi:MAG: N-acetylmuramoyl-L-alanine amidase AmiC precursor [Candidatus Latescibacteria bacterium ADurb.Bin168]|nr:MAG: N-acetylmuramoyl-L-alanine amidase AmiC precursor [Candidatus Latescibacteria bacterium ADurb.Bin168]
MTPRRTRIAIGLTAAALVLCTNRAPAGTGTVVVVANGANRSLSSSVEHGVTFVSVPDLARALELQTEWDARTRTLVVISGETEAEFIAGNTLVMVGDSTFRLPRGPVLRAGELLAPADALPALFSLLSPAALLWDDRERIFRTPADFGSGARDNVEGDARPNGRNRWEIDRVVIDPGHGGRDPGTLSVEGVPEKDIALAISVRLAQLLRDELGVDVVMTRTDDQSVSLRERGLTAVRAGGKLFVSIHCNAIDKAHVSGVQTYFLSDAETDEARAVARAENAALMYEEHADTLSEGDDREMEEILAGLVSDRFLKESQELAALVQRELVRGLRTRDMGVHQAGFFVMKGTLGAMPSILIETGYLTNQTEAARLRDARYQARIADAILRAVREFKMRYETEPGR